MMFIGGTIIIGSLLWEMTQNRDDWRSNYLNDIATKIPVKLKIRYGRKSQTRQNTYTMIFSNHTTTKFGQGYILSFKKTIDSFSCLEKQAFALAKAEGISSSLNASWGSVGLLFNPNIDEKNKLANLIRQKWIELYRTYNFNPKCYCIENELPTIDSNGLLKLEWTEEMNAFDFLIATTVVPNIKYPLPAIQIADKMKEENYFEYFEKNLSNNIKTFQDDEIRQELERNPGSY